MRVVFSPQQSKHSSHFVFLEMQSVYKKENETVSAHKKRVLFRRTFNSMKRMPMQLSNIFYHKMSI